MTTPPDDAGNALRSLPVFAGESELAPADRERIRRIFEEGTSPHTRRAITSDLEYFEQWFTLRQAQALTWPVEISAVLRFITDHLEGIPDDIDAALCASGRKRRPGPHSLATVQRRASSLSQAHSLQGLPNPCSTEPVRELLRKARRRAARQGVRSASKRAATRPILEELLGTCGDDLAGRRDRAMLMFGFASGGRRRAEIADALVEDLEELADGGFLFRLRHSKTDQEGDGLLLPVLGRAGEALRAWLAAAVIERGPLFRPVDRHGNLYARALQPAAIAAIVKRRAAAAGFAEEAFGGHSLRSGFVTEAGRRGLALGDTLALSGHRVVATAMRYYQPATAENNPAGRLLDRKEIDEHTP